MKTSTKNIWRTKLFLKSLLRVPVGRSGQKWYHCLCLDFGHITWFQSKYDGIILNAKAKWKCSNLFSTLCALKKKKKNKKKKKKIEYHFSPLRGGYTFQASHTKSRESEMNIYTNSIYFLFYFKSACVPWEM